MGVTVPLMVRASKPVLLPVAGATASVRRLIFQVSLVPKLGVAPSGTFKIPKPPASVFALPVATEPLDTEYDILNTAG